MRESTLVYAFFRKEEKPPFLSIKTLSEFEPQVP